MSRDIPDDPNPYWGLGRLFFWVRRGVMVRRWVCLCRCSRRALFAVDGERLVPLNCPDGAEGVFVEVCVLVLLCTDEVVEC